MTTNSQLSLKPWDANPWSIRVRCGNKPTVERMMLHPIALIGSHARCHVRVKGEDVPEVAYLVVALASHIEVWPLAAIAFPRWGPLRAHQELLVGRLRMTIIPHSRDAGRLYPELPTFGVEARLSFGKRNYERLFRRHVTIVGKDHPSSVRLYDHSLRSCDFALVIVERRLWLVDLVPDRWPTAGVASDALMPPLLCLDGAGTRASLSDVEVEMIGIRPQHTPRSNTSESSPKPSDLFSREPAAVSPGGSGLVLNRSVMPIAGSGQLSAQVTERLVQINHSRFFRRRMILATTSLLTVAIVVLLFLKIVARP